LEIPRTNTKNPQLKRAINVTIWQMKSSPAFGFDNTSNPWLNQALYSPQGTDFIRVATLGAIPVSKAKGEHLPKLARIALQYEELYASVILPFLGEVIPDPLFGCRVFIPIGLVPWIWVSM
jgi:hypothetical protein